MDHFDKYADLTGKRLAGEITPAEQVELDNWLQASTEHRAFAGELERAWQLSESAENEPFSPDMAQAWASINTALNGGSTTVERPAKVVPLSRNWGRWRIAAAILALLAAGLWWLGQGPGTPTFVEVRTSSGERREILLPDGSKVTLNENSTLGYAEKFAQRNVTLTGEAFFEVARMAQSPFTIASGRATTTVLGTSFNVRAYPDEQQVEVSVKTGRVALALAESKNAPVLLEAGTAGVVKKTAEKAEKTEAEAANADAWKTMRLEFDDAPISEVVATLERYFGKKIEVSDETILDCVYKSEFDNPDLPAILAVIGATIGVEVEPTPNGFRLNGRGAEQ